MSRPRVQPFRADDGTARYVVSTPTNSKRLIFKADELAALGSQIAIVLGGTDVVRSTG